MTVDTAALRRSPLADMTAAGVQEIAGRTKITLRAKTDDKALNMNIQNVLGVPLTAAVNRTQLSKNRCVLCLGPDEWMLWADGEERQELFTALQEAVKGQFAALVDVSDYYTIIRLSEEHAVNVLAASCPLDLETIKADECAQSRYANAAILLRRLGDTASFDVQVRRSFAAYLWRYFTLIISQKA